MAKSDFAAVGQRRKRGRPPTAREQRLDERVEVSLTTAQKTQLEADSDDTSKSPAELLRACYFEGQVRPRRYKRDANCSNAAALLNSWSRIEKLDKELSRLDELVYREGNNVNQIARDHNTDGADPELAKWSHLPGVIEQTQSEIRLAIADYRRLRESIEEAVEELVAGMPDDVQ